VPEDSMKDIMYILGLIVISPLLLAMYFLAILVIACEVFARTVWNIMNIIFEKSDK